MYPRRISQTIVSSPNLKNVLLANFHRHYFVKYSLMIRQQFADLKNIKEVNKRLQDFIKNGKFYAMIVQCPESKNGCKTVLKIWAHHCECVIAQRIRRCQQMFCLYSKWWEERALKEFICTMRQRITKKGKEFALGAIGISAYNWEENRISDESLKEHVHELEYIYELKDHTICLKCDVTTKHKSDSIICKCGTVGKPSQASYDQWTTFIEKNDLIVWRRLHPSGNFEYKVFGSYGDVSAEDFLNVQIDTDYRRKWDTTAVVLEVAETDPTPDSNSDIIYWEMLWPRLFVNRDYVFNRRYLVDKEVNTIYIVSKSTQHPKFPKYPEKYRIEDYFSCMVIKPYTEMDKPGIEFSLTYFDNPGVNIPSSVTTWVSMRAMPDFLERLRIATKTYKDYCLKEGVGKACDIIKKQAKLADEEKLEYCAFTGKEKLAASKPGIQDKKAKPSDKYSVNSGNVTRNIDINSSDINSTPPSAAVQSKDDNNNFWKYLHPLYYFH